MKNLPNVQILFCFLLSDHPEQILKGGLQNINRTFSGQICPQLKIRHVNNILLINISLSVNMQIWDIYILLQVLDDFISINPKYILAVQFLPQYRLTRSISSCVDNKIIRLQSNVKRSAEGENIWLAFYICPNFVWQFLINLTILTTFDNC